MLGDESEKERGIFFSSASERKKVNVTKKTSIEKEKSQATMPHVSARPLALAWQLRTVVHSRSTLLASSSQQWLSTSASSAAEASAASKGATEKKSSTSPKEQHDPKKKENEPKKPESKEEIGGPRGPEPTRYNDWEKNGRVSDF